MRVLVVDDDEIFCRFLAEVLEEVGMGALCITDGLAAYDLMKRDPYGICIIDVRMPLILGTELADAIKEDHPGFGFSGPGVAGIRRAGGGVSSIKAFYDNAVDR